MPTEIKLQDRDTFASLITEKPLGDPAIGPKLPGATVETGQSFAGEALSVNVHGELSLRAFNSGDDVDEDGIYGAPPADLPVDKLPPQIQLPAGKAYMKYRAAAGLKATGDGALGALSFSIKGGLDIVLADYHLHPGTQPTRAALLEDIKGLRTSLKLVDVLDLQPGEAVSQQVIGQLSAAVEVSWSDVFLGPIGPLSRLAGGAAVLVKVSAGATLKASISLSDDFLLVFSRVDQTRWRVGLRKAATREAALGLDLGVTVEFADPAQVQSILDAALEGVIGRPLAKVDALLAKASLEGLSDEERAIADLLIARLGLDRAVATVKMIREKVDGVRAKIKETVEAVAKAKVSLGFAYEYRRMRQDTTVAQCTVTRAGLDKHHGDLVRGRFDQVFADAANGVDGSALEHYLYQKTVKSSRSWGFTLSIGKWLTIGGRDHETLTSVDRKTATGAVQRSFVGTRGYRYVEDEVDRWSGDFSAAMPGFSQGAVPLVSDYHTGLSFNWFESGKLTDDTLSAWLDLAVLWGAASEAEVAQQRAALAAALNKKCSIVAQVTFPHAAFSLMRPRIAVSNFKDVGAALGAAMPWSRLSGRSSLALRRRVYAPLWEAYLSDPDNVHRRGRDFAAFARQQLTAQGFAELGNMERLYEITPSLPHDGNVFCGLIDLNPSTFQNCRDFFNAIKRLNMDVVSGVTDNKVLPGVFKEMESLWRQGHHVRAVGAYLLDVAATVGVMPHVGRSVSITVGTGADGDPVFVLGR